MLIYFILALLLGICFGSLTGLIPGIHINLIAIILLGFSSSLLNFISPLTLIIFITAMAITHTFVDFIPAIFLGAPDEDSVLSILPGHKLLLKGNAYIGIILTLYGSVTGLIIILIFTPIFIYLLPIIYPYILRIMPIILILVSGYLIYNEKCDIKKQGFFTFCPKKIWALTIFLLAGFLGIATLNLPIKEPLLPLLTGLFEASNLIISIKQKTKIPKQKIFKLKHIKLRKESFAKSTLASIIAAPFTAFLPGLGASQAAVIGSEVTELNQKEFLFLLGAINTIVMGLSFITLYSIQKTRTGAAVAISKLIPELTLNNLLFIIGTIILAGIIAFFITIFISKFIARKIHTFNYSKLSITILLILIFFTIYFTGFMGVLIFIISASLGITTILLGIRRMHLMGCLLVPSILFYIF